VNVYHNTAIQPLDTIALQNIVASAQKSLATYVLWGPLGAGIEIMLATSATPPPEGGAADDATTADPTVADCFVRLINKPGCKLILPDYYQHTAAHELYRCLQH
jgi:hypothetical protein